MGSGPGPFFLGRVAAAMLPALIGVLATAGMILAGEGPAAVLDRRGGHGEPHGPREVADEGNPDDEATADAGGNLREPAPCFHGMTKRDVRYLVGKC